MHVILAQPRGFCAGVVRAIEIVEQALRRYGPPVYVRHEIVHNRHVVESLRAKGARFVEELDEVPTGAMTIFSAHGVARRVEEDAAAARPAGDRRDLPAGLEGAQAGRALSSAAAAHVVLIGHAGHPEVEGTMGSIPGPVHLVETEADVMRLPLPPDAPVAYVTQTTLSVDDTRGIIAGAARALPRHRRAGHQGHLLRHAEPPERGARALRHGRRAAGGGRDEQLQFQPPARDRRGERHTELPHRGRQRDRRREWLEGAGAVGVTAGASAPESLVEDVIDTLAGFGPVEVSTMAGRVENIEFRLPAELTRPAPTPAPDGAGEPPREPPAAGHQTRELDGDASWAFRCAR